MIFMSGKTWCQKQKIQLAFLGKMHFLNCSLWNFNEYSLQKKHVNVTEHEMLQPTPNITLQPGNTGRQSLCSRRPILPKVTDRASIENTSYTFHGNNASMHVTCCAITSEKKQLKEKIFIKIKCFCYYNVYILIVKLFIPTKI